MQQRRIKVTGKPKQEVDIDLLVQAILRITEQRLQQSTLEPEGSSDKPERGTNGSGAPS